LHTLRHYWGRLFSRQQKPSDTDIRPGASPDDLEREISAIAGDNHALAEEVQRVRTDFEHAREEEDRKIVDLEHVRQAMERDRKEDQLKLAKLESLNNRIETARDADSSKIHDLENQLAALQS
jgi:hypothetical protein